MFGVVIREYSGDGGQKLCPLTGTFEAFKATLEKTFTQIDEGGHARAILKTMRQKKGKLAEYISDFKIQAGQSGIDSEPALAEYFMEGIQLEILKDIFQAGAIPTKMEEWYNETSRIVLKQLRLKEIEDQRKGITNNHQGYYGYNNSLGKKDPNAMDVDRLSTKELERHKKERLCFRCRKPEHIGQNCRNSGMNQKQAESKPHDKKKVRNNMIRKILAVIDDEEEQESKEENKEEGKEEKDKKDF